jgi:hypothetical protein
MSTYYVSALDMPQWTPRDAKSLNTCETTSDSPEEAVEWRIHQLGREPYAELPTVSRWIATTANGASVYIIEWTKPDAGVAQRLRSI